MDLQRSFQKLARKIFNPLVSPVLLDVLLGVVQDHWLQAHVARGIDAVHVAEGSGHGEVAVGDGGQGLIDLPHLLEKSSWMKGL